MEEFIVVDIDAECEVETLISFVDDFEVVELGRGQEYLDEVGLLGVTSYNHSVDLGLQTDLLALVIVDEPFGKTSAAPTVLQEDETDLSGRGNTIWM